jgi:glycosyltransferase involved in cell wall biosynthesis
MARGRYIAIVDADDEIPEDSLQVRYEVASRVEESELVIGACEVFRGEETLHVWKTPSTSETDQLRREFYLFPRQPFHLNACLLSKSLVERTGLINEKRDRCEDIDYALRLLENVRKVSRTDQVTYRYRKYRSSFVERIRFRWSTLINRVGVMSENLDGLERVVGIGTSLAFDILKMVFEIIVGAYPKRSS